MPKQISISIAPDAEENHLYTENHRESMNTAGIDIGSISTKAAIMKDGLLLGTKVISTGYNAERAGGKVFDAILGELSMTHKSIDRIVTTGYGRKSMTIADRAVTEITCHAAGALYLNPSIRTIIDVGGQDSKAISVDGNGVVMNFIMNDKCAAGTGRFPGGHGTCPGG